MASVVPTDSGIEQLLRTEAELHAPAFLTQECRLRDFEAEYKRSVEDPDAFWEGVASELEWFEPWKKVFEWNYPTFQWFVGGKFNITYNALDRQVREGR